MKLTKLFVLFLVVGVLYFVPSLSQASYITLPGMAGTAYDSSDCLPNPLDGSITNSGSDHCYVIFPIQIATGSTLSSITLYYYDNSGSQYMYAYLYRSPLSSDSIATNLVSGSDTSTSASVQSKTLSYGSATSSSYTYFVYVILDEETELRGIKIYYY